MILTKRLPLNNFRIQPALAWSLTYLLIAGIGLHNYINWVSPVFLLGVVCLLQVSLPGRCGKSSVRFAYISIAFGVLSIFLPVKTILYGSGCAALLFVLESNFGKVRHAAVLTLMIMSPVFEYATNVFSFPVRLWLTGIAGSMMRFSGRQVFARGNMLMLNGNEFSVDPECMGLHMLQTSLLMGIMICSFYTHQYKVRLRLLTLMLILLLITGLNVMSNLFRIIALVQFNIHPGTVLHEVIGLCCLLVYISIPGAFMIRMLIKNNGKFSGTDSLISLPSKRPVPSTPLYIFVAAALSVATFNNFSYITYKERPQKSPLLTGYTVERIDADILKLKNAASLVYIKHIEGFYNTEHNPMICWKGSGYSFERVEKNKIDGQYLYTAVLTKGEEQLYTAWWYDNSKNRTISQMNWRLDVLKGGADYALVNITCADYSDLNRSVREILNTGSLNKLLRDTGSNPF